MSQPPDEGFPSVDRRDLLEAGAAASVASLLAAAPAAAQGAPRPAGPESGATVRLSTRVNGRPVALDVDARASLLDLLRERLGLTGSKKGCDHGQCGACTVHVEGRRVAACLTLAAKVDGREVTTIEGLSDGHDLHPMQQAFIDHDALQCGYCTPGQIMAAIACVQEGHASSREEIREYMSGNICRCGAYVGIVAAVEQAAAQMRRS
ncbi:(2Fe-2S)-binding protein [Phenylobacterium terrae]|uniref:(2Fe-2S)-binding protein n=1 Tax=Phenylobacterium terrae TaxID=2665495 RepID=A0ABW4N800_9CAUL